MTNVLRNSMAFLSLYIFAIYRLESDVSHTDQLTWPKRIPLNVLQNAPHLHVSFSLVVHRTGGRHSAICAGHARSSYPDIRGRQHLSVHSNARETGGEW